MAKWDKFALIYSTIGIVMFLEAFIVTSWTQIEDVEAYEIVLIIAVVTYTLGYGMLLMTQALPTGSSGMETMLYSFSLGLHTVTGVLIVVGIPLYKESEYDGHDIRIPPFWTALMTVSAFCVVLSGVFILIKMCTMGGSMTRKRQRPQFNSWSPSSKRRMQTRSHYSKAPYGRPDPPPNHFGTSHHANDFGNSQYPNHFRPDQHQDNFLPPRPRNPLYSPQTPDGTWRQGEKYW